MRKWKETKSECEDSKRNYQNEAKKEKKIGKKWKVSVMHGTISSYLTHLEFES